VGQIIRFRKRQWTNPSGYPTNRQDRKSPAKRRSWWSYTPEWLAAAAIGTAIGVAWAGGPKSVSPSSLFSATSGRFGTCYAGGGRNCVVDGDTFYMDGVKIRIAGIDAPETHPSRCAEEGRLGTAATKRLRELLNSGAVTMTGIDRDEDVYGRKLRNVQVSGSDVGETLISEGLAHRYTRGKLPWCL